jgi:FkbM family methyltransferase
MIILDVGAKDGKACSLPYAQDPANVVYSIEPAPDLADQLRSQGLPNLLVYCVRLGDEKQLDAFMREHSIEEIDLLNIANHQQSLPVIKGAGERISAIKTITLSVPIGNEHDPKGDQLVDYLLARGFRLTHSWTHGESEAKNCEFIRVNRYNQANHNLAQSVQVAHVGSLKFPPDDHVGRLLEEGVFEGPEQAFMWLFLRPGDIFLDCGAHAGLFSAIAAKRLVDRGKIIAVEPNPTGFEFLKANLDDIGFPGSAALQLGLSNRRGHGALLLGRPGMSAFSTFAEGMRTDDSISDRCLTVEQTTLDDLLGTLNIGRVDVAKLDVEGWETSVINGARRSILAGTFPLWMVEFTEVNALASGTSTRDLRRLLESLGYTLCHFDATDLRLAAEPFRSQYAYKNLFAVMDVENANKRLESAPNDFQLIAKEIVTRWDSATSVYFLRHSLSNTRRALQECQSLAITQQAAAVAKEESETAQRATRSMSEALSQLRELFTRAELTRSRLLDELHRANQYARQQCAALSTRNDELGHISSALQTRVAQLERELVQSSTSGTATRNLIKNLLRRFGIFDLAYRNHKLVVPVYNALFRENWKPATITVLAASEVATRPRAADGPEHRQRIEKAVDDINTDSPRVRSFAFATDLGLGGDPQVVGAIGSLVETVRRVLCIRPTIGLIPLLQFVQRNGASITCVDSEADQQCEFTSEGVEVFTESLADWMIANNRTDLADYDLVAFGAPPTEELLLLLKGRLARSSKIVWND